MSHGSFAQHTRRQWLAGGGGLAAAMVMPPLLRGRELAGAAKAAPAKAAIVIYLQGGLSHYESFDPKPNAPTAYRGEFNPSRRACRERILPNTCHCSRRGRIVSMC